MQIEGLKDILACTTNRGDSLADLGETRKVMLVFLRHFGCTFCREALADMNKERAAIEAAGAEIVLVHQVAESHAEKMMKIYGLEDLHRISDPNLELYDIFNLKKGSFRQLFGLRVWLRGMAAGLLEGHMVGPLSGNGFQMPGIFLIHRGKVLRSFVHKLASDRPNYSKLAACSLS